MEQSTTGMPSAIMVPTIKVEQPAINVNITTINTQEITYNEPTDTIIFKTNGVEVFRVTPSSLLDVLDQSLLMKLYKIRNQKEIYLVEYVNENKKLIEILQKAEDKFTLLKCNYIKNVMKEVRFAIRMAEQEETKIKNEMLERQLGGEK